MENDTSQPTPANAQGERNPNKQRSPASARPKVPDKPKSLVLSKQHSEKGIMAKAPKEVTQSYSRGGSSLVKVFDTAADDEINDDAYDEFGFFSKGSPDTVTVTIKFSSAQKGVVTETKTCDKPAARPKELKHRNKSIDSSLAVNTATTRDTRAAVDDTLDGASAEEVAVKPIPPPRLKKQPRTEIPEVEDMLGVEMSTAAITWDNADIGSNHTSLDMENPNTLRSIPVQRETSKGSDEVRNKVDGKEKGRRITIVEDEVNPKTHTRIVYDKSALSPVTGTPIEIDRSGISSQDEGEDFVQYLKGLKADAPLSSSESGNSDEYILYARSRSDVGGSGENGFHLDDVTNDSDNNNTPQGKHEDSGAVDVSALPLMQESKNERDSDCLTFHPDTSSDNSLVRESDQIKNNIDTECYTERELNLNPVIVQDHTDERETEQVTDEEDNDENNEKESDSEPDSENNDDDDGDEEKEDDGDDDEEEDDDDGDDDDGDKETDDEHEDDSPPDDQHENDGDSGDGAFREDSSASTTDTETEDRFIPITPGLRSRCYIASETVDINESDKICNVSEVITNPADESTAQNICIDILNNLLEQCLSSRDKMLCADEMSEIPLAGVCKDNLDDEEEDYTDTTPLEPESNNTLPNFHADGSYERNECSDCLSSSPWDSDFINYEADKDKTLSFNQENVDDDANANNDTTPFELDTNTAMPKIDDNVLTERDQTSFCAFQCANPWGSRSSGDYGAHDEESYKYVKPPDQMLLSVKISETPQAHNSKNAHQESIIETDMRLLLENNREGIDFESHHSSCESYILSPEVESQSEFESASEGEMLEPSIESHSTSDDVWSVSLESALDEAAENIEFGESSDFESVCDDEFKDTEIVAEPDEEIKGSSSATEELPSFVQEVTEEMLEGKNTHLKNQRTEVEDIGPDCIAPGDTEIKLLNENWHSTSESDIQSCTFSCNNHENITSDNTKTNKDDTKGMIEEEIKLMNVSSYSDERMNEQTDVNNVSNRTETVLNNRSRINEDMPHNAGKSNKDKNDHGIIKEAVKEQVSTSAEQIFDENLKREFEKFDALIETMQHKNDSAKSTSVSEMPVEEKYFHEASYSTSKENSPTFPCTVTDQACNDTIQNKDCSEKCISCSVSNDNNNAAFNHKSSLKRKASCQCCKCKESKPRGNRNAKDPATLERNSQSNQKDDLINIESGRPKYRTITFVLPYIKPYNKKKLSPEETRCHKMLCKRKLSLLDGRKKMENVGNDTVKNARIMQNNRPCLNDQTNVKATDMKEKPAVRTFKVGSGFIILGAGDVFNIPKGSGVKDAGVKVGHCQGQPCRYFRGK